jgi:hypothetical protein
MKPEPIHHDLLGTQIKMGDYVAFSVGRDMCVGTVTKMHNKMIGVTPLGKAYYNNFYSKNVVIVDGPKVTMYLLKK